MGIPIKPKDNAGFAAGKAARAVAEQTPPDVLTAMLARPHTVHGVTLQPLNLDILWVLQKIGHPLGTPGSESSDLSGLQVAQLIFAFAAIEEALDAVAERITGDDGLTTYDREAFRFVRAHVPMKALPDFAVEIGLMISEGLATAPGAGDENPPAGAAHAATP